MRKQAIVAAIDVGTTKVCTIVAEVAGDELVRVAGVGINPSRGLHKGLVLNISEARESIRQSVSQAEQVSGYKIESALIGVTGRHISSTNNRGFVAIARNEHLVHLDDLKRVLQSAQSIKMSSDRRLLHVIPLNYAVDGQVGVKNPVGMRGSRLDVETHVITASVASVQNLVKCIQSIGIGIEELVFESLASSQAVLTEDEKEMGVILADVGGGTTDIAVFKEGSIWHTAVLPVAGYQITRDIAISLGLPFDVAEEMKKQYGSVMPVSEGRVDSRRVIDVDGRGVSYQDLCDIIRARVAEILKLILLELPRPEYELVVPAGLVLTGGNSNLSGIDAFGRELLRLPVRIGVPSNTPVITDDLRDPACATGVGLLLWGVKGEARHEGKLRTLSAGWRRLASRARKVILK